MVSELTKKIAEVEVELVVAQQNFLPENPEVARRKQLLEALNRRLEERRKELVEEFDTGFAKRLASPPVVSAMVEPNATSDAKETRIKVDLEIISVPNERTLAPEAAAKLASFWNRMYERKKVQKVVRAEELQTSVVQLLECCAEDGQGDSDTVGILVDLLTSLEYVRVMLKPEVEVYSGKQAEITSKQHVPDPTAEPGVVEMVECEDLVKLTPRADSTGRIALDIAAEICDVVFGDSAGKTPGITKHSIDTKAVLGEDKTLVLRLESTTEAESQDDSVLYLLVRPRIVSPESTATFTGHGRLRQNAIPD